jgi:hypothetical protein
MKLFVEIIAKFDEQKMKLKILLGLFLSVMNFRTFTILVTVAVLPGIEKTASTSSPVTK